MNKKYLIISFFLSLFAFFSLYLFAFFYQINTNPLKSEMWIRYVYNVKENLSKKIHSKKIIIISGSNSLFGINSELIAKKLNIPVSNLSVHASLDIDYLFYIIKNNFNNGDIVVMPLEYPFYTRKGLTDWFTNNITAWDEKYFFSLSIYEKIIFIINVQPKRILLGIRDKILGKTLQFHDNNFAYENLVKIIENEGEKWRGYNFQSLNLHGDINVDQPLQFFKKNNFNLNHNPLVSEHFIKKYNKIKEFVESKNGKIFLVHPVTASNESYNLYRNKDQLMIKSFVEKIANLNIKIECNPGLFHMEDTFFFDTTSHPNKFGAIIRSENLATCINDLLNDKDKRISIEKALETTTILQNKYYLEVKKPSVNISKIRFHDLEKIKIALQYHYEDNGFYPVSKGFDGIYTKWGHSDSEWIKGLAPKYIKYLPIDPKKTNDPSKQYLYKSDGKDYKLISHSPEDCDVVKKTSPEMMDPKRPTWAYGFWTKGATSW